MMRWRGTRERETTWRQRSEVKPGHVWSAQADFLFASQLAECSDSVSLEIWSSLSLALCFQSINNKVCLSLAPTSLQQIKSSAQPDRTLTSSLFHIKSLLWIQPGRFLLRDMVSRAKIIVSCEGWPAKTTGVLSVHIFISQFIHLFTLWVVSDHIFLIILLGNWQKCNLNLTCFCFFLEAKMPNKWHCNAFLCYLYDNIIFLWF